MTSSTKRFSALVLALMLIATPAFASKKSENQRAAELAMKAVRLYRAGQNADAAKLFLEAYAISKRPAQLRNAAKAYEEIGMLDQSHELWTRYRDHKDVSKDEIAEADAHLKLIAEKKKNIEIAKSAEAAQNAAQQALLAAEAAQKQAEEASKQATRAQETTRIELPPPTPADQGPGAGSYILMGGGTAAAIAGGVLLFVSSSNLSKLDQKIAETNGQGLIVGISPSEIDSEVSGINTTRVVSGVLLTAGATALVSGVVWLLLDDS